MARAERRVRRCCYATRAGIRAQPRHAAKSASKRRAGYTVAVREVVMRERGHFLEECDERNRRQGRGDGGDASAERGIGTGTGIDTGGHAR
jgi:hypothetical protein